VCSLRLEAMIGRSGCRIFLIKLQRPGGIEFHQVFVIPERNSSTMCLKEKVLGGRASFAGVYFATPKFVVACRESGDAFELVRYENSLCMYPEAKIPVVRSIHRLFFMFQLFLINRRIKAILFIAALFAVASDVHAIKNPGLYDASLLPWDMLLYIAAAAVVFAAVTGRLRTSWKNTKKLLQYHGAEHKVINAIQYRQPPTT